MSVPNLPPRTMVSTPVPPTSIENPTLSPLALLVHFESSSSDHQHVFKSIIMGDAEQDPKEQELETVDGQDLQTMPLSDTTTLSNYICQVCHAWLYVSHSLPEGSVCSGPDYLCHHYHAQGLETFACCGCDYILATELHDAVLPMAVLNRLSATRPKARSLADMMQNKEQTPTMSSTLSTVLVYIKDLLTGLSRNINTHNPHFLARIGLSDGR